MNRYLSLAAAETQSKASMSDYWHSVIPAAGKSSAGFRRRFRLFLRVMTLSALLPLAARPAAAGCFYFHNAGGQVFHVSVDASDIGICPTGTCWAADIPPGATQEYCPGPMVLPLPPPPGLNGPENGLFIKYGGMTATQAYLSGLRRDFTCNFTIRNPPNYSNSFEAVGCEAARIGGR